MSSFRDVAQLINGPEYPNSVQWADDGTLAVAGGSCVGILHPGSLAGAQAFAAIDGFAQDTIIAAPGKPNGASIHFDMALSLRVLLSPVKESAGGGKGSKGGKEASTNTQSRRPLASAKAIAWSPTGAATAGGCFLASVTNDHRVIVFGPDDKMDPEWRPLFTVHENLLNHLTETHWRSIDAVTLRASGAVLNNGSDSSSSSDSDSDSSSDSSSSSSSSSDSSDSEDEEDAKKKEGKEEEEEMLRLRGGAGGISDDGEDTVSEDEEQAAKKKQKTSAEKAKPAAAATTTAKGKGAKAQKQQAKAPAAPSNRRKSAAPQVAPAGDATDLGGGSGGGNDAGGSGGAGGAGPLVINTAATAAFTPQALAAGIPPVEFHTDRLEKLDIADTVAKRFFELRRQLDPESLPIYPKTSSHLTGIDKETLEKACEEYSQVYGEKIKEIGFDKKKFWQECRIALPRCWNKKRNVFLEGFEQTIGMGLGPGGEIQESSEDSDSERTESEPEQEAGEEGARKLRRRRAPSAKVAAAAAAVAVPADVGASASVSEGDAEAVKEKKKAPPAPKRKRVEKPPVFERPEFQIPATTDGEGEGNAAEAQTGDSGGVSLFTWRDLPPVDNANRTSLKHTLVEGAVKRFLRLRAAEPAELLPTYPSQKSFLKGVDAWISDRVIKEYMYAHAPAMAALQYDSKKFNGFFNSRLRQVWDRSVSSPSGDGGGEEDNDAPSTSAAAAGATTVTGLLEATYDIFSDNGLVHPEGSGESGLLGPIPVADKVDVAGKKTKAAPKPPATTTGGGSAKAAAVAKTPKAPPPARPSGGAKKPATDGGDGGGSRAVGRSCYGKDSLGGSQWWGGSNMNSDVYERRLLSISAISVSWSPAVTYMPTNTSSSGCVEKCSFLAVGTKEGSIWLWRCRHPAVPALPRSMEEETASLKERMTLIGRLPGNLCWADTMKWVSIPSRARGGGRETTSAASSSSAALLVLVVGTSDGAVTLWGSDSSSLASFSPTTTTTTPSQQQQQEQQSEFPLEKWNTLLQPDLIQVISLDAALRYNPGTDDTTTHTGNASGALAAQLVVAMGKSAGIVCAWTSSDLSFNDSPDKIKTALQKYGQFLKPPEPSGLGSSSVTGVGLAAGAEMVVACTREGALESWSLPLHSSNTDDTIASGSNSSVYGLQPRSAPVACSVRKQKESGFGSFGVAISPGGMFVGIPKNTLPCGIDFVKQLQVWQRLTLGLLHLHRIAGPGAEVDGFAAVSIVCRNWAAQRAAPAAVWDAVTLCRMQEGLASAVAEALETEFLEIKNSNNSNSLLPSGISDYAWRLLKAAVTLRRAEAAAAVAAAAKIETLEIPHQELLDRDQMLLLQRQLEKLLNNKSGGNTSAADAQQQQLRRLLAADCVVANAKHNDLMIGLLSLAVKAYHEAGETPPGEANAFAIPSRDGGKLLEHRPVAMVGGSASAALSTMFHEEGQAVVVHRCPATLEVSFGEGKWVCRGCQRAYNELPQVENKEDSGGSGAPAECVMCGGLLGPYGPDFLLIPPCI